MVDYLDAAKWQGRGYASVRNTYLLDAYPDELPNALKSMRAFGSEDQHLASHSGVDQERILKRAESLHESPDDTLADSVRSVGLSCSRHVAQEGH